MKSKLLLAVLALQCAVILGTVGVQELKLDQGRVVLLETQPVDPRDLLRGDYVALNYTISTIQWGRFTPPLSGEVEAGTGVFVALAPAKNHFYVVARASTASFSAGPGEVLLSGKIRYSWSKSTPPSVRVDYGLERFYVREGTGNPTGKLTVRAAVPASGRAIIKEVW